MNMAISASSFQTLDRTFTWPCSPAALGPDRCETSVATNHCTTLYLLWLGTNGMFQIVDFMFYNYSTIFSQQLDFMMISRLDLGTSPPQIKEKQVDHFSQTNTWTLGPRSKSLWITLILSYNIIIYSSKEIEFIHQKILIVLRMAALSLASVLHDSSHRPMLVAIWEVAFLVRWGNLGLFA